MKDSKNKDFSKGLASLRGLAASIVVVYHALLVFRVGEHGDPDKVPFDATDGWLSLLHVLIGIFNGSNAVILFFVLSGTVLTLSLQRSPLDWRAVRGYYIRRSLRILPLLAVAAVLSAGAHFFLFSDAEVASGTDWMNRYYRHDPDAWEVGLNAIGWSNSLNSPAWTIRVELIASMLFPLLYLLVGGYKLVLVTLTALTALAFADLWPLRVHTFLIAFYLGALVPSWGRSVMALLPRQSWAIGLLVAGLVAFSATVDRLYHPWVFIEPLRVIAIAPAAALLVALVLNGAAGAPLTSRFFLFLGEISYSMYLLHFAVLFALARGAAMFLPDRLPESGAVAANLGLGALALLLAMPISYVAYRTIELPFQRLGRRLAAGAAGQRRYRDTARAAPHA